MRKLFITIASIFATLGLVFSFLPLGTIALIPILIALVFAFLALKKSTEITDKKVPKILLLVSIIAMAIVLGKEALLKDKVEVDNQFEKEVIKSENEAKQDLEDLESLE
jgi:EamA domain-containing membrane protein RarD